MIGKKFSSADLLLLCVVIIWGSVYTFGKIALREFDPLSFAALRTILAAPILLVAVRFKENGLHLAKKDILPFVFLGFLGHFLNRLQKAQGSGFTRPENGQIYFSPFSFWYSSYSWSVVFQRREGLRKANPKQNLSTPG